MLARPAARALAAVLAVALAAPALAFAQQPQGPPPPTPAPTGSAAPAPSATDGPKNVTGYGWGDDKPRAPAPRVWRSSGPTAVLPGFEQLDTGSRFFVQLTKAVPVEEKRAAGTITYVLKGARVNVYNNERPLVTVHFNTPVWRARLVPRGADLHFILELRAPNVVPIWKMETPREGVAVLTVDLPAGDWFVNDVGARAPSGPSALPAPAPSATTAPPPPSSSAPPPPSLPPPPPPAPR